MLRRTKLKRTAPMPHRTHKIANSSPTHRAGRAAQGRAYAAEPAAEWCAACGCNEPLDHSHILSQKQHPKHRNNPLNWLMLCRSCHRCWEDNKGRFKLLYPLAFAEKVRRMEAIDCQAAAFFKMKFQSLFQ
jgi:hypothetical protein